MTRTGRSSNLGTIGRYFNGTPYYWWGSYATKDKARKEAEHERRSGHPSRVVKYGSVWAVWRKR